MLPGKLARHFFLELLKYLIEYFIHLLFTFSNRFYDQKSYFNFKFCFVSHINESLTKGSGHFWKYRLFCHVVWY